MRRIYAALLRFDDDADVALPRARAFARHWVSQPWGGWPSGHAATEGSFTIDDQSIVRWRTLEGQTARLWELRIDESFPDDLTMRQSTLVQVGADDSEAFAFVQVSMRSTDGTLSGGVVYENDPPEVVPLLVDKVPCSDGGRTLTSTAWRITRAEEKAFASLLTTSTRRLPTILFAADAAFDPGKADEVARTLAGLAHVAVVPREQVASLSERTGLDLAPGVSAYLWWASPAGPHRRPQWFRGEGLAPSQWGTPAWPVVRTVFGVAAFRLDPPTLASQLEAESAQRRIRAVEAKAASSEVDAEMYQAWESDLVQLEHAERRTADLEVENDRLQADLNALLAAFDVTVADAVRAAEATRAVADDADTPASLADAVALAEKRSEALLFLPEAQRSADEWRYQRPEIVLAAFRTLDGLAQKWRDGTLDGSFVLAATAAGLPWRPSISPTAQQQFRDDYVRRYRDREILLGPHLAWGNSPDNALRVYLYLDRETRTIVVGHAGRHLRDTSNPHL